MAFNISDLSITSFETIIACDINGGAWRFTLDELQNVTLGNTQENTNITGKAGRTIGTLKRNKSVTISGTNGMFSMGLIEAETGVEGSNDKVTKIKIPEYLVVNDQLKALTTYKAVGTAGNEIGEVFVRNSDGTIKKTLKQDSAAAAGKFAYDPSTKEISFAEGDVVNGDEITIYYKRQIKADAYVENISDKYSEKLELYLDFICEDKCKNEYRGQIFVPYADFDGNFELAMGDSQTTQAFTATSLASSCNNTASLFWTMTIFGTDTEDVE